MGGNGAAGSGNNTLPYADGIVNAVGRTKDGKPPSPHDQVLTYLPLGHVAERIFSTWTMCANGVVLNFA